MTRGRTVRGRSRTEREPVVLAAKPLFEGRDHGDPIAIRGKDLGYKNDDWVEPFLVANQASFRRLDLRPEIRSDRGLSIALHPHARIGAAALVSPSTRKVAAGLLVAPRFAWRSLGAVYGRIGFAVEPSLGAGPLVPGSARAVPPWLIAGPVLRRIEAMLRHTRRGFVEVHEQRAQPRGRIDWSDYARNAFARGRWAELPCVFSEPERDPALIASARWTVRRVIDELAVVSDSAIARTLIGRGKDIEQQLGPGPALRPGVGASAGRDTAWVTDALEAMGWVADERGLGGARALDGLAWDLAIDAVWERWVATFAEDVGQRIGLRPVSRDGLRFRLAWSGRVEALASLVPDAVLLGADRAIVIEAKYKSHFQAISQGGLSRQGDALRAAHRADVHQALAYAALYDAAETDIVLTYPALGERPRPPTMATLATGRRSVRVWLSELPFGFEQTDQRDTTIAEWSQRLARADA